MNQNPTISAQDGVPLICSAPTKGDMTSQILAALLAFKAGDFSVRLPHDMVGVEGKIADAFNDIASIATRQASEIARVCQAVGKNGWLKQRLSVPFATGGWAEKVDAINTLIDDLVWPTTEVTRTISAVAKGDLTRPMALEVEGRPLEGEFLRSARIVNTMMLHGWRARWAPRANSAARLRSKTFMVSGRS
jgi:hypothetical protein